MSKIQINADIDSGEIFFEYQGKDLQKPLEDLHAYLKARAKALMDRTGIKSTSEIPHVSDLTRGDRDAQAKHEIKLALSDAFEAQLWCSECKRTPDRAWRLTMNKLRWLYRHLQENA